jgi:cell division protein FtsI (penicillin-binding protein 3)
VDTKKDILWRVYLSFIGLAILAFLVFGKAAYIQIAKGDELIALSKKMYTHREEIEAERGTIYSEDGKMLCTSIPIYDIHVDFEADGLIAKNGILFYQNVDSLAYCLSNLFRDKTKESYIAELKQGFRQKERYYLLKKDISFEQYHQLKNFPLVRLGKNKSGFIAEENTRRLNPYNLLAFRTIGLVKKDTNYNVGLERYYDSVLRGTIGSRVVKLVAGNIAIPVEGTNIEPEKGKDLITTLDAVFQDIAETALYKKMKMQDAQHGTCIIMEVKTGKIKAIANLGKMQDGSYWENYNYALESYEPGSTAKLASIIALIEDGYADLNTPVNLHGGTFAYNRDAVMYDSESHGKYQSNLLEAFEESSNVGISYLVYKNYNHQPNKFTNHYKRFQFHKTTGIDLIGERNPKIPQQGVGGWSNISLPWMSVGYEMQINPLQVLSLYNAVANNGVLMKPYLVSAIKKYGVTIKDIKPTVVNNKICSPSTLQKVKMCLEGVVKNGTAKSIKSNTYGIAGKTGTALFTGNGVTYNDKVYVSSFAGYFPADNPQYSCIVVIKNKKGAIDYVGAKVAAPVFKEIADRIYGLKVTSSIQNSMLQKDSSAYSSYMYSADALSLSKFLGIPYTDSINQSPYVQWKQQQAQVALNGLAIDGFKMPQVIGMNLKDALYLLENKKIKVKIIGVGKVIAQSIAAGNAIATAETVTLTLQ